MSKLGRRNFIVRSGMALGAGMLLSALKLNAQSFNPEDWQSVRAQFKLDPEKINMALMLLASHPKTVADAIDKHRKNFIMIR